jgi:hypothetical protein
MRIVFVTLTLFANSLAQLSAAYACRGGEWEYSNLMHKLHPAADSAPVVAEVEVLELLPHRHSHRIDLRFSDSAKVRVVRSIKGSGEGAVLTVYGSCTSCGGCFVADDIGARRFVAGEFQSDSFGAFVAPWAWHFDGRRANSSAPR